MSMGRRRLLLSVPPTLLRASGLLGPSLVASSLWSALSAAKPQFPAALLVPRTGDHAALGRSMERAALLAQGTSDAKQFHVFDTLGTPNGAITAAKLARHADVRIILGPIFAAELPGVIRVAGPGLPVISFSNDAALRETGAFVIGITAEQIVTALLHYAAGRGIRRVAVAPVEVGSTAERWHAQVASATGEVARALGLEVTGLPASGTNGLPDAVLFTDSEQLTSTGPALARQGMQVIGAVAGLDLSADMLRALEGAWFAAPDPAGFDSFARAFEERVGSPPGLITGLAYDAMRIVLQMRQAGGVDRSALLAATGFPGVCGSVRFHEDGSAARMLAILAVKDANLVSVPAPLSR